MRIVEQGTRTFSIFFDDNIGRKDIVNPFGPAASKAKLYPVDTVQAILNRDYYIQALDTLLPLKTRSNEPTLEPVKP